MLVAQEFHGLKSVLEVHNQYMRSLPTRNWYGTKSSFKDSDSGTGYESKSSTRTTPWPEADALRAVTTGVTELQVKIQAELRYAKLEAAWGKLSGKDISTMAKLLKGILVGILGMESLTEVADRIEKRGGWGAVRLPRSAHDLTEAESVALEEKEKQQWTLIVEQLRGPVHQLQQTMINGLEHSMYMLEFAKRPATHIKMDIEANGVGSLPGDKGFAPFLEGKIQEFLARRESFLKEWCALKGVDYPLKKDAAQLSDHPLHERHQSQLYLVLNVSCAS
jgi:hypothetical protein